MRCNGKNISSSKIEHLGIRMKIQRFSDVGNILAFLQSCYSFPNPNPTPTRQEVISDCCSKLQAVCDGEDTGKLTFLIEQLKLVGLQPNNRRYSPALLSSAVLWHNVSPALYRQFLEEELITLPTVRYIQRISSSLSVSMGLPSSSLDYLSVRFKNISEREKTVCLLIDEVYSAKRIEYSGGKFYGYEDSQVTKTLLTFMIKSVAGSYSDVVAMVPLANINSKIIKQWYDIVLKGISSVGFDVVAICTDAHSANRRFFVDELCEGHLKTWVKNPYTDGPIFILFDSVHIFKNMYNNLVNRKKFKCPNFEGKSISAEFQHFEDLYELEVVSPVKYAHKLSNKVIAPKPIERTKVELADKLFHESTIQGLQWYSKSGHSEWEYTANFCSLIRRWWNTVNVKSPKAAIHKRDETKKPITLNTLDQVDFLKKFVIWLNEWENMSKLSKSEIGETDKKPSNKKKRKKNDVGGLSSETFMAVKQTSSALVELSSYLLKAKGLSYVLLGMINSDPLERRFGWFRQLSGANYYISCRQFLEAEKKIRVKNLVKFGGLTMQEIRETIGCHTNDQKFDEDADQLLLTLNNDSLNSTISVKGNEGIIFYVAGYIARSLLKSNQCKHCVSLLVQKEDSPEVIMDEVNNDSESAAKEDFLEMVNRGGLSTPSDLIYLTCILCLQLREEIFQNQSIKELFLSFESPRSVFVEVFERKMSNTPDTLSILNHCCQDSHSFDQFVGQIAFRFFNVMSKNFIGELNSKIHEARKRDIRKSSNPQTSSSARKISKLQG